MFESVAAGYISDEVEIRGFTYGASLEYVLYGFIPRVLWPDKPTTSRGGWFTRYIGVNYASSTGMTSFGELYWNFGFIGVAIRDVYHRFIVCRSMANGRGLSSIFSFISVALFLIMYGMMMHPEAGRRIYGNYSILSFFWCVDFYTQFISS